MTINCTSRARVVVCSVIGWDVWKTKLGQSSFVLRFKGFLIAPAQDRSCNRSFLSFIFSCSQKTGYKKKTINTQRRTFVDDYKSNWQVTFDRILLSHTCCINHEIEAKHSLQCKKKIPRHYSEITGLYSVLCAFNLSTAGKCTQHKPMFIGEQTQR